MNTPAFIIRNWISIGLSLFGFLLPFLVAFYLNRRYSELNSVRLLSAVNYQWLPFIVLLWLLAAYISPFTKVHWIGWIFFVLGILLSFINYSIVSIYSQQSIFYTTRHWVSIWLHLLGFAVPFIVTIYLRSKYSSKSDIGAIGYQWIPVTSTLWLIGAYVYPESRVHLLGWVLFGFGITLSTIWYSLIRIYR
jgi:hypothetical protein